MIPIKFANLHNPLFLGGKNHKDKLYDTNLKMIFDVKNEWLTVVYLNEIAFIPKATISSMTPQDSTPYLKMFKDVQPGKLKKTHISHASKLDIRHAQVSDPSTTVQNPRKDLGQ